jgi:enoyl-CoA hydratase/carnithine racemase
MSQSHARAGGDLPGFAYTKADGIATVRLDRPARGNAFTTQMRASILRIWDDVRTDDRIRVVIITGTGERHFCTGADVGDIAATGTTPSGGGSGEDDNGGKDTAIVWSPIQNDIWKPVICAVNGLVAGGGLHFVADADIVVAAEHAAFMDTHVNVGQVGAVENIGLAHRMPLGAVLRMTLQGKAFRLSAQRAFQLGLVDEVVPFSRLAETARAIALDICTVSPRAAELSKRAIWQSIGVPREQALAEAWQTARDHWGHPDFAEGARAFAERRAPRWTPGGAPE